MSRHERVEGRNPKDIWQKNGPDRGHLAKGFAALWEDETDSNTKSLNRAACKSSRWLVSEAFRGGRDDHGLRVRGSLQRGGPELTMVTEREFKCAEMMRRGGAGRWEGDKDTEMGMDM